VLLGLAACGEARWPWTPIPPIGGRRLGLVRCAVDLRSGVTVIERPTTTTAVEESLWPSPSPQAMKEGRLYQVVIERSRSSKKSMFKDRALVSLRETDSGTGDVLRVLPLQEFRGDHEGAVARAMTVQGSTVRFWMEFWMLD
jgi:hypothetical protein